jgi:hypothetical protein
MQTSVSLEDKQGVDKFNFLLNQLKQQMEPTSGMTTCRSPPREVQVSYNSNSKTQRTRKPAIIDESHFYRT